MKDIGTLGKLEMKKLGKLNIGKEIWYIFSLLFSSVHFFFYLGGGSGGGWEGGCGKGEGRGRGHCGRMGGRSRLRACVYIFVYVGL